MALGAGCGAWDATAERVNAATTGGLGGVVSDIPSQDGVCSVAGLDNNASPCATACCDGHDRCYAATGCRASSWLAGPAEPTCDACNTAVVQCLWACASQPSGAQDSTPRGEEGSACATTSQCDANLVCGHRDNAGRGWCTPAFSGGTGAECTVPVDCQSALCINGGCAPAGPRGAPPDNWVHRPPPPP